MRRRSCESRREPLWPVVSHWDPTAAQGSHEGAFRGKSALKRDLFFRFVESVREDHGGALGESEVLEVFVTSAAEARNNSKLFLWRNAPAREGLV